jgi:hypothetical protein
MQRRVSLRRKSKKRAAIEKSVAKARQYLREEAGRCEACGHSPYNPWPRMPAQCSVLTVQEICRGSGLREKALGKRHSCLVLCWFCNSVEFDEARIWPEAKQLALLQSVRRDDYDLVAHNNLVNPRAPNRIAQAEVDQYADEIRVLTNGRA